MANVDPEKLTALDWPNAEDETWEFKSSLDAKVSEKLPKYISGFANAGGGCLLWGVDEDGNPDGGIDPKRGRQDIRDWLDKAVKNVSPLPNYKIIAISDVQGRGQLESGKVIVAITVDASPQAPHQDTKGCRYFIRMGSHTLPAPHYLVEALWAKRQTQKPVLRFIAKDINDSWINSQCFGLINLTPSPAIRVLIRFSVRYVGDNSDLSSRPPSKGEYEADLITIENPYDCDFHLSRGRDQSDIIYVEAHASYCDLSGNQYEEKYSGMLCNLLQPPDQQATQLRRIADILGEMNKMYSDVHEVSYIDIE